MADNRQQTTAEGPGWAVWAQSAVNGMLGDYLQAEQNPLAIGMGIYTGGRALRIEREALAALQPLPTARIVLLVHGLGCSENMWNWHEQGGALTSYGHMLQADLGYTPIALRYNSGLPIAANGRRLSTLLEELEAAYPLPIEEILLIGHSMGGLVIRHACHTGTVNQSAWVRHVRRVIYLGTPHEGADLERFAHAAATTLAAVPNPITLLVGQVLNLRSQGVRDLRHGAQYADVSESAVQGEPLPWLPYAQHYLIAGTVGITPTHAASLIFGDGLVRPPRSATQHSAGAATPPATHIHVFAGLHHMGLARSHDVYAQIQAWCTDDAQQGMVL